MRTRGNPNIIKFMMTGCFSTCGDIPNSQETGFDRRRERVAKKKQKKRSPLEPVRRDRGASRSAPLSVAPARTGARSPRPENRKTNLWTRRSRELERRRAAEVFLRELDGSDFLRHVPDGPDVTVEVPQRDHHDGHVDRVPARALLSYADSVPLETLETWGREELLLPDERAVPEAMGVAPAGARPATLGEKTSPSPSSPSVAASAYMLLASRSLEVVPDSAGARVRLDRRDRERVVVAHAAHDKSGQDHAAETGPEPAGASPRNYPARAIRRRKEPRRGRGGCITEERCLRRGAAASPRFRQIPRR